jgi:tetratricopeptide (TPR) repeat protein
MNLTLAELSKLAIKAAFNQNWNEAVEINTQILTQDEKNIDAFLRLGLAYLQLQDYTKAKKAYSKVLEIDPINKIALDKMKQVKEKKTEDFIVPGNDSLLKEPGNSIEANLEILTKGITADKFKFDETLILKISGKTISVHRDDNKQSLINYLSDQIVRGILKAHTLKATITVKFIGGKDKKIKVIINSSESVFPSEKQDIKPYIKGIGDSEMPEMVELTSDNEDDNKKIEPEEHQSEEVEQPLE